jgi:asparagine synthase (glutamine-hydrolysing)
MCGILGVATALGSRPSITSIDLDALRETLSHRGPDDAGAIDLGHVRLGHRRLAIMDLSPAGHQPIVSPCGGYALVYNGELYNDAELRADLAACGVDFRTRCDTETLLHALIAWGAAGPAASGVLARLRGMFALAFVDLQRQRLLLARDPLGIKPLYYELTPATGPDDRRELRFSSELAPLVRWPGRSRTPDLAVVSSYLTTIRTTLEDRTLYAGIHQVRPGECLVFDLQLPSLRCSRAFIRWNAETAEAPIDADPIARVREAVIDSMSRHARSDAPLGALLSGGLDSTIICTMLMRLRREQGLAEPLHTFCAAGAHDATDADVQAGDAECATLVSAHLGTEHHQLTISRELFHARWPALIKHNLAPLSTPNEIGIDEIARVMRAEGLAVALSGEGADELFAGYGPALADARRFEQTHPTRTQRTRFLLTTTAWIGLDAKPGFFRPGTWRALEHDSQLVAAYEREAQAAETETADADPLQIHLAMQRRVNLQGLLMRLDACTMRHSIEGRTPLADSAIAAMATSLPMRLKGDGESTKIALRRAFASDLPPEILTRPKASFPLPFQAWLADSEAIEALRTSTLIRELFSELAIEAVAREPERLWPLAWPIMNLALWDRLALSA